MTDHRQYFDKLHIWYCRKIANFSAYDLLRTALSTQCHDVAENTWQFTKDKCGKPYIAYPEAYYDIAISISHCPDLLACAIADDGAIGIDVESCNRPVHNVDKLLTRFFPQNKQHYGNLSTSDKKNYFFMQWTHAEAYAKATGLGLRLARINPLLHFYTTHRIIQDKYMIAIAYQTQDISIIWHEHIF